MHRHDMKKTTRNEYNHLNNTSVKNHGHIVFELEGWMILLSNFQRNMNQLIN